MSSAVLTIGRAPGEFSSTRQPDDCVVIPSSLDPNDPCLVQVLDAMSLAGRSIKVRVPSRTGRFRSASLPGSGRAVRLDREVVDATRLITVVNLDRVGTTGPFALDLLARYLSPIDRARLLISPDRLDIVARLNLIRPVDWFLVARTTTTGMIWIETRDPIAAELVSLALSEDLLPASRARQSPWEDDLVQRATELELGVRYPGDIRLVYDANDADPDVKEAITALHLRIGIDI